MISNLGSLVVNCWLFPVSGGCALVDTGYAGGYDRFRRRLERRGLSLREIRYVFLTHAHDDHAGFLNDLLLDAPHIRVICSPGALPVLRRGQNGFSGGCTSRLAQLFCRGMALWGRGDHRFPPLPPVLEDRCLPVTEEARPALETALGGRILATPGHTADSLSLLLPDGSLFCGDAAMSGFPSLRHITIWAEDAAAFSRSWERLLSLKVRRIYPGHGRPFAPQALERCLPAARAMPLYPLPSR